MKDPDFDGKSRLWIVGSILWLIVALTLITAMQNRNMVEFVYRGF